MCENSDLVHDRPRRSCERGMPRRLRAARAHARCIYGAAFHGFATSIVGIEQEEGAMKSKFARMVVAMILAALVLSGCAEMFNSGTQGGGSVHFTIGDAIARTVQPVSSSITVVSYSVSGTGPGTASIAGTPQSLPSFTISSLAVGTWSFTVNGLDASGNTIATGSASSVSITAGGTATASVALSPVAPSGSTGTFTMAYTWTSPLSVTQVSGSITPVGGTAQSFASTISGSTASYSTSSLAVGSYTLLVNLTNSAGASRTQVYALRIYKGLTSPLNVTLASTDFPSAPSGTITGTIRDAVSSSAISGVAITVSSGSTQVATATSDSAGSYSIGVASGTSYTVQFQKTGYVNVSYSGVAVTTGTSTYLQTVLQVSSTYTGTGTVSGTITNAYSGAAVSGAALTIYAGIGITSGTVIGTTTTTSTGTWTYSGLTSGSYTVKVTATGFSTAYFTVVAVGGLTRANQNTSIAPTVTSSQVRFVLTWGSTPSDLDSHMSVPLSGSTYHVYFSDKGNATASPYTALDHDVTSGYGPETITVYTEQTGDYYYYVYDYTNGGITPSSALANSGAQVNVYMGSSLVATYNVPSSAGTLWKVCKLNGTTLTPINLMFYESSSSSVTSHALAPASLNPAEAAFFKNLPAK